MDVGPSDGGTVQVNQTDLPVYPSNYTFGKDSTVYLEAVPAPGYRFEHWSGDLSGNTNPTIIVIDCNKKVTADFSQVKPKPTWWLIGGIIAGVAIICVIIWFALRHRTT